MSVYWRYGCIDCDQDCDTTMNHGDGRLRVLAETAWPGIRQLYVAMEQTEIAGWMEIGVMGYPGIIDFLRAHDGHRIELRNEYGDRVSLNIPGVAL